MTSAAVLRRSLLAALAVLAYAGAFAAFAVLERPGLGLAHLYYLPITLLALAAGPLWGALGGLVALGLYALGVLVNEHVPPTVQWASTSIRLATFVGMGVLVGWYAQSKAAVVAELERLAQRDELTGLPNTRSFEAAIERRLAEDRPFALLVGDVDSLGEINGTRGRAGGDDALRRLADLLARAKRREDEVARVGGDEFAILTPIVEEDGRALAVGLERFLAADGVTITFGWATYPRDGRNGLALYRAADERMYARKLARGYRRGEVGGAAAADGAA